MIAPVRCRSMLLQGEAARLLGSQKSRRFCRIAKSPTSFDPASIASGGRQPLMSAPASVPRVARPSEATSFARSAYITDTDIIFFMLCAIATFVNSALVNILSPQQGDRPGRRGRLSAQEPMLGLLLVPYAGCLSGGLCSGVLSGASAGSPPGDRCSGVLSWADVIDLHEIHLARQSSLQVPVGHIVVPGGIKLCSPGPFWWLTT